MVHVFDILKNIVQIIIDMFLIIYLECESNLSQFII